MVMAFCFLVNTSKAQDAIRVTTVSTMGQPMIFLPHIGCSSDMWKDIALHYSKTNACYLVDLAGFAEMPAISDSYTETYTAALSKFIKEKNLTNCIIVGQNYGGHLASKLATQLPGNVNTLVMADYFPKLSMVLGKDITKEKLSQFTNSVRTGLLTTDTAAFEAYQKQTATGMNFMDSSYIDTFVKWQLASDRETLAGTLVEQMEADQIPFFEKNTIPTLIFNTWYFAKTYQKLPMSAAAETLNGMYPGAKLITLAITEDAKDFIANDQPEWFTQQLDQFLKTNISAK